MCSIVYQHGANHAINPHQKRKPNARLTEIQQSATQIRQDATRIQQDATRIQRGIGKPCSSRWFYPRIYPSRLLAIAIKHPEVIDFSNLTYAHYPSRSESEGEESAANQPKANRIPRSRLPEPAKRVLPDKPKRPEPRGSGLVFLVALTRFELAISALRGRRPKPLDDRAICACTKWLG